MNSYTGLPLCNKGSAIDNVPGPGVVPVGRGRYPGQVPGEHDVGRVRQRVCWKQDERSSAMKCPHCQRACSPSPYVSNLGRVGEIDGKVCFWSVEVHSCPECRKPVLSLIQSLLEPDSIPTVGFSVFRHPDDDRTRKSVVVPRGAARPPAPPEVPADIASDFNEACLVLVDSPKASAALSRRCLQHALRERNVSTAENLGKAIEDALATHLPLHIGDNLDAIRNIGNFAAHPQKSERSGEILDVEPGEAEWNLDVLESLFDHYYVQPTKSAARREALDKKLAEARKKPMKRP